MPPLTMIEKLKSIGADLIVLKRQKRTLHKDFLSNGKIRGVVCSENTEKFELSGKMM
jgi:hypothetical protein